MKNLHNNRNKNGCDLSLTMIVSFYLGWPYFVKCRNM